MSRTSASTLFPVFERAVISLYDGGVLSPAVLERVIGAFAQTDIDWRTTPTARSVDGRTLRDIVAQTMLPGDAPKSASSSFAAVIGHIAGAKVSEDDTQATSEEREPSRGKPKKAARSDEAESSDEDSDNNDASSEELLAQLSGNAPRGKRKAEGKARPASDSTRFNPLLNAALPHKKKD